jgi:hypothetical protein
MMALPSKHSSIATCLWQNPMGNCINDLRRKKDLKLKEIVRMYVCMYVQHFFRAGTLTLEFSPTHSRASQLTHVTICRKRHTWLTTPPWHLLDV